jgi:hypothetical protein
LRRARGGARRDRLRSLGRLTARDRTLLGWLAEHYLLSSTQISQALFPSERAARLRLAQLHAIDAVHRFVDVTTGSRHHLYTLGDLGLILHPTSYNHPDRSDAAAPRTSIERTERIIGSPTLAHLLGVNQFFIDLHAYARTTANVHVRRWWSEQHATATFRNAGIHPDAHGVWQVGDRTVGFWLEHDRGTEKLLTVLNKLRRYAALADAGGPRYPILIRVPGRRRERHLLDALTDLPGSLPVATGVHEEHPAGPAWTLAGDRRRLRHWLHELPSDHGPVNPANNPDRYPEPDQ